MNLVESNFNAYYNKIKDDVDYFGGKNSDFGYGKDTANAEKDLVNRVEKGELIGGTSNPETVPAQGEEYSKNYLSNNGMRPASGRDLYTKLLNALDGHGSNIKVAIDNLGVDRDGYPTAHYNNQDELDALIEIADFYGIDYKTERHNGGDRIVYFLYPDDYDIEAEEDYIDD